MFFWLLNIEVLNQTPLKQIYIFKSDICPLPIVLFVTIQLKLRYPSMMQKYLLIPKGLSLIQDSQQLTT